MVRSALVVAFLATGAAFNLAQPRPDEADVRKKLHASTWQEYAAETPREKQVGPNGGVTWDMYSPLQKDDPPTRAYQTWWDDEAQQVVGELILNVNADPIWLDFKFQDGGRDVVWAGILRFEGTEVHWVRSGSIPYERYRQAHGRVRERPSIFADAKGNPLGYHLVPLKSANAK